MTFVVTDACIQCKYTDCVAACPVDCFQEGPNFLVIDPAGCIDCAVCVPECPVNAIYAEDDLPAEQRHFLQLNAEIAASGKWPMINRKKDPHPQHEQFKSASNKLDLLDRAGA